MTTKPETPALPGDLTDETIERGARALAGLEPGEDWPTNEQLGGGPTGTRDDEYRDSMREQASAVLAAARVAPARPSVNAGRCRHCGGEVFEGTAEEVIAYLEAPVTPSEPDDLASHFRVCDCHDSWDQCPCAEGGHPSDSSCSCCPRGTGICGPKPAPSPDREKLIDEAEQVVHRHLSRLSKRPGWDEDETAIGGQAAFIVSVLFEEGALAFPPVVNQAVLAEILEASAGEWGDASHVPAVLAQYISRTLVERQREWQGAGL